jgi:hypothetical protein
MDELEGFRTLEELLDRGLIEATPVVVMLPSEPTPDEQTLLDQGSKLLLEHILVDMEEHINSLKKLISDLEPSARPD